MKETKVFCDFCKKETNNPTQYKLPCFVTYDARDRRGNLIQSFITNEIIDDVKDVCPACRKRIALFINALTCNRIKFDDE